MTKNVILSAFETDGTPPAGLVLGGFQGGTAPVIETADTHPWGTVASAGSHVIDFHVTDTTGYVTANLILELAEPGYVTFWAARDWVYTGYSDSSWAVYGSNADTGDDFVAIYDIAPGDWQQFYLPLGAGRQEIDWTLQGDTYSTATSAQRLWISRVEVYEGDDVPTGQGPYGSGDSNDPRAIVSVGALLPRGDATIPTSIVSDGVVEPNGTHLGYFRTTPPSQLGAYVIYMAGDTVGTQTATITFNMPADGKFSAYVELVTGKVQGTLDGDPILIFGPDNGYYLSNEQVRADLPAGDHVIVFTFETVDPSTVPNPQGFWLSRIEAISLGPVADLDYSPSGVGGVPDDGGGTGGGGTAPVYGRGDIVRHNGGTYVALIDQPTSEPADGTDWVLLGLVTLPDPRNLPVRSGADNPFGPGEEGVWVALNPDGSFLQFEYQSGG